MFLRFSKAGSQTTQAPAVRWSSHSQIIRVCMGIFMTALKNKKNTVKFSIKIPHLTSTMHRLLSDRLLFSFSYLRNEPRDGFFSTCCFQLQKILSLPQKMTPGDTFLKTLIYVSSFLWAYCETRFNMRGASRIRSQKVKGLFFYEFRIYARLVTRKKKYVY